MSNLEQIIMELTLDELIQLEKIITQQKLKRKPRMEADIAYTSQYQEAVYIRKRKVKSLERALKSYRNKLEANVFIGYRIRQFDGSKWEVVEEAGDTARFV